MCLALAAQGEGGGVGGEQGCGASWKISCHCHVIIIYALWHAASATADPKGPPNRRATAKARCAARAIIIIIIVIKIIIIMNNA